MTRRDIIEGFVKGQDGIVVSAIDANSGVAGNQAFVLDANNSFSAGEIRQKGVSGNLLLEFNVDADATVEMAILLNGVGNALGAGDFVL
jgi:serralysin